jgi:hypothetical protein
MRTAALALALAIAPAAALAQPAASPFTAGVDGGGGFLSVECPDGCQGVDPAVSLAGHIGGMLTRCQALLFDGWTVFHTSETGFGRAQIVHTVGTLALQGWVVERFWLRGGLGLAYLRVRIPEIGTRADTTAALMGAAGYEAFRWERVRLDIVLRASLSFFDEEEGQDDLLRTVAVGAGLSWH